MEARLEGPRDHWRHLRWRIMGLIRGLPGESVMSFLETGFEPMFGNILKGWFGEKATQLGMWCWLDSSVYHRFHDVIVPSRNETTQVDHVLVGGLHLRYLRHRNEELPGLDLRRRAVSKRPARNAAPLSSNGSPAADATRESPSSAAGASRSAGSRAHWRNESAAQFSHPQFIQRSWPVLSLRRGDR